MKPLSYLRGLRVQLLRIQRPGHCNVPRPLGEGDILDSAAVEELKSFAKKNPDLKLQPASQTAISVALEAVAKVWAHLLFAGTMLELAAPDAVAMSADHISN